MEQPNVPDGFHHKYAISQILREKCSLFRKVDSNDEGHHERRASKTFWKAKAKRQEKKVNKLRAPKAIRVESEKTLDYVREAHDMNQEEAEEMSFVPSAISVPKKAFDSL